MVILSVLLGNLLLSLPNPCNRKLLQSLHGACLNHVFWPPLHILLLQILPLLLIWMYRHYGVRRPRFVQR